MEKKPKRRGRPPRRKELMALSCTAAQYLVLKKHVAQINEQRKSMGMPLTTLSEWVLDVVLREAGCFELTSVGMTLGSIAVKRDGET